MNWTAGLAATGNPLFSPSKRKQFCHFMDGIIRLAMGDTPYGPAAIRPK